MKIKKFGLLALGMLTIWNNISAQPRLGIPAKTLLKNAVLKAKKENKQVLLVAYSSTNAWSPFLQKVLNNPEVKPILSKNFVLCEINPKEPLKYRERENPDAKEVFDQYYIKTEGIPPYPAVILLDQNVKVLAQFSGGFTEGLADLSKLSDLLTKNKTFTFRDAEDLNRKVTALYKKIAPPAAQDIISQTVAIANKENKKAFIIFHASWCHWCHVLDTAMSQPSVRAFFDKKYAINHITVLESENHITDQNPGAKEIIKKYQGPDRIGIPYWIIIDKNGKFLADYNGYPDTADESTYKTFEKILRETGGATPSELEEIKRVFASIKSKF